MINFPQELWIVAARNSLLADTCKCAKCQNILYIISELTPCWYYHRRSGYSEVFIYPTCRRGQIHIKMHNVLLYLFICVTSILIDAVILAGQDWARFMLTTLDFSDDKIITAVNPWYTIAFFYIINNFFVFLLDFSSKCTQQCSLYKVNSLFCRYIWAFEHHISGPSCMSRFIRLSS